MAVTAESVLAGDRLALSRLITQIENGVQESRATLDALFPYTGNAYLIGVTGPSGSGKSTLVNQLALKLAQAGDQRIGIIAVDPTSPFSGGALLGDRVRMSDLFANPNIFIRSMATRGALGGLARAADDAAYAMDAAGYAFILIETVGAGQSEVEIAKLAHTTIVVEAPGLGDDVQAGKAGLLEIADILVVNKSDRLGAEASARALENALALGVEINGNSDDGWQVPVLRVSALHGEGLPELVDVIYSHRRHLQDDRGWAERKNRRARSGLVRLLKESLYTAWQTQVSEDAVDEMAAKIAGGALSPEQAAKRLLET